MCTNLWLWKLSGGMAGAVVPLFAFFPSFFFLSVFPLHLEVLCKGLVSHLTCCRNNIKQEHLKCCLFVFLLLHCLAPFVTFVNLNGSVRYPITLRRLGARRRNVSALTKLQECCPSNSRTCSWGRAQSRSSGQPDYGHYAIISREVQFITCSFLFI